MLDVEAIGSGGTCASCGNTYDKAFTVTLHDGATSMFDSVECSTMWLAPRCASCGVQVLGHGLESGDAIYCCAPCAGRDGNTEFVDRVEAEPTDEH
jgi:hypothetical protein